MNFWKQLFGTNDEVEKSRLADHASTEYIKAHGKNAAFGVKTSNYEAFIAAKDLADTFYDVTKELIRNPENNNLLSIRLSAPSEVSEPNEFLSSISPAISEMPRRTYYRWKATGALKTLSVRATQNLVEIFIVPNQLAMFLSVSEFGERLQAKLILRREEGRYHWLLDDKTLNETAARQRLLECLAETADQTIELPKTEIDLKTVNVQDRHNRQVDGLLLANQNLLFKLVNQQEATKNEIARELHDSVLADLMMLKRYLSGDKELSKQEFVDIVDDITRQLRDIVNECTPKALNEWGLKVSLESLLQKLHERQGIICTFAFKEEIHNLPEIVELNIYRIFQECINNVAKYAFATQVDFKCERNKQRIIFTLKDNGKGFAGNESQAFDQGYGLRSMQERTELIRCFLPTRLLVESKPGKGTMVILEIETAHEFT